MSIKIVITVFCLMFMIGCAHQDDVIVLDQRLQKMERLGKELDNKARKLENDYAELTQSDRKSNEVFAQDSAALGKEILEYQSKGVQEDQKIRALYAGINANIVGLQDELQGVRGSLEENEYLLKQRMDATEDLGREIQVKFDKMAVSLDQIEVRLQYIEQYLNLEPALARTQSPSKEDAEGKKLTDGDLYISSKQAFDQGDFDAARAGFDKIIKDFPKSEHADNAQFWIGEIYYREKWYEKAILEYQKVIENYPKGNKVPASLLKQGFAFLSLGDKANARLILKELAKKYPETNEGKIAVQKLREIS